MTDPATEFIVTDVPAGSERQAILDLLNEDRPWLMVSIKDVKAFMRGDLQLRLEIGGGLETVEQAKGLLTQTLRSIP